MEEQESAKAAKLTTLGAPSQELCVKLLCRVPLQQGLMVQEFRQTAGVALNRARSLEEVAGFLAKCTVGHSQDEALVRGGGVFVGYVSLHALKTWIADVLGDEELALAIESELGQEPGSRLLEDIAGYFRQHAPAVRALLEQRLEQCRAATGAGEGS